MGGTLPFTLGAVIIVALGCAGSVARPPRIEPKPASPPAAEAITADEPVAPAPAPEPAPAPTPEPAPASAPEPAPAPASPAALTRISVVVHVATRSGARVMDDAQVLRWFGVADEHFAPAGIALAPELRSLPEGVADLERVRDRRALKRFLVPNRINVFLVGKMLDPVASAATKRAAAWQGCGRLAGAHIEADGHEPKTYVIVSAEHGSALALTHELGHFFGVAHHRDPTNLMSYGRQRARFDERQLETFRRNAKSLLRRRVLRAQ
jgi:hypothetical protein